MRIGLGWTLFLMAACAGWGYLLAVTLYMFGVWS